MRTYRNPTRRMITNIIIVGVLIFTAYFVSRNYVQVMLIQGNSMSPSYRNMQLVLLNKYSENYHANDVIAFHCEGLEAVLVKRIVAVPGDTVQIIDNILYVNGQNSSYYADAFFSYAGIAQEAITIAESQYFVIGDNIEESRDSRYEEVGMVHEDAVIGKVIRRK